MHTPLARAIIFLIIVFTSGRCVYHDLPIPGDCSKNPIQLSEQSKTDTDCGLATGAFEVVASGGTPPYRYKVDAGTFQQTGIFGGLASGSYEVTVADAKNCSTTFTVDIANKEGVNVELSTSSSGCKEDLGTISAIGSNGVEPYQYRLDQRAFQPSGDFHHLAAGSYTVTVKDASGCEASKTIKVLSGVSFDVQIAPIINNSCAISGCHNGTQFPDFRSFANIKANASQIKTLTGNRTMPEEGTLTQNQIDMIACWVDDGALDN